MFGENGFSESGNSQAPADDGSRDIFPNDSDDALDMSCSEGLSDQEDQEESDGSPTSRTDSAQVEGRMVQPDIKPEVIVEDMGGPFKKRKRSDAAATDEASSTTMPKPSAPQKVIIRDFSRRTFGAMLLYLHTGGILFNPLRCRYGPEAPSDYTREDFNEQNWHRVNTKDLEWPCSPKSIFRYVKAELMSIVLMYI